MSWWLIARKDATDLARSAKLWAVVGISLVLMVVVGFGIGTEPSEVREALGHELVYLVYASLGSQFILPVICLLFGYLAIAGERESGSLRVLFGLNHNRQDVFLGKLLSRSSVMLFTGLITIGAALGLIIWLFDSFDLGIFLQFSLLTLLLILAFTGLAVGISAMAATRTRAMAGAIGSYVAFFFLWYPLVAMVHYALEGDIAGYSPDTWYLVALMLNPLEAYREALGQVTDNYVEHVLNWDHVVEDVGGTPPGHTMRLEDRAMDSSSLLTESFAMVVLLAWFVIPVIIGYWRFQRVDLN